MVREVNPGVQLFSIFTMYAARINMNLKSQQLYIFDSLSIRLIIICINNPS